MGLSMSGYQSFEVSDAQESLAKLAGLVLKGMETEDYRVAAVKLVKSCLRLRQGSGSDRDSMDQSLCELEALFQAITDGDKRIDWLREGVGYIADPAVFDLFHNPGRIVALCRQGACAVDCDDHSIIMGSLAGCVGFKVGLRAWGKRPDELTHVYTVVRVPKVRTRRTLALDTSTGSPKMGWQPKGGHVVTCWIEADGSLSWETGMDND